MGVRRFALVVSALVGLASACSSDFDRDDAIAAIEASGVSRAEATCMADTLVALGRLEAADVRAGVDVDDRDALMRANERCVSRAGADDSTLDDGLSVDSPPAFIEITDPDDPAHYQPDPTADPNELRSDIDIDAISREAHDRLRAVGRSDEFADCVVDRLVTLGLGEVLADPAFGMGADPVEADAMAACN